MPMIASADPAPVAVGQVFHLDGRAWIRASEGEPERLAARGAILRGNDHLRVAAGAELGIYYRQGGRRIVHGGRSGVSGPVSTFSPTLQPYRGAAVTFGATRAPQADGDATTSREDTGAWYSCTPGDPPIFAVPPSFTLGLALDAPETPIFATLGIRIRDGDTVVAEASLSSPRPGQRLRLATPAERTGRALQLEIVAEPLDQAGAPFVHAAPFYVLAPSTADTAASDLVTDYLFGHGTLAGPPGSGWSRLSMQQELEGVDESAPSVSTILTPFARDRGR